VSEPVRVVVELLNVLELVGLGAQAFGDAFAGVVIFFTVFSIEHPSKIRLQLVK
jgi:hypothetical protein